MNSLHLKNPYIIEVWEDKYIRYDEPKIIKKGEEEKTYYGYWDEIRSVRVGDSEIDQLGFAFSPILHRNVNGEITFTFSLYGYYYDGGEKINNYLTSYIFNETKIKLFYKGKWYDFIVKNIKEKKDSKGFAFEYQCEYLPMIELAKNGWELNFSIEQENCIGTIGELTNYILEGTDWEYRPNENCNLSEYNLEFMYNIKLKENSILKPILDFYNTNSSEIEVGIDNIDIFTFYTDLVNYQNRDSSSITADEYITVIYQPRNAEKENAYTLLKGTQNYKLDAAAVDFTSAQPSEYYGYRIIETPKTEWVEEVNRYVTVNHVVDGEEVKEKYYGYAADVGDVKYTYAFVDAEDENKYTDKYGNYIDKETSEPIGGAAIEYNRIIEDVEAIITTETFYFKKNKDGSIYKLFAESGYGAPFNAWGTPADSPIQIYQQPSGQRVPPTIISEGNNIQNTAKTSIVAGLKESLSYRDEEFPEKNAIINYQWYYKDLNKTTFEIAEGQTTKDYSFKISPNQTINIIKQPYDIYVNKEEQINISVEAEGTDLKYQWQVKKTTEGAFEDITEEEDGNKSTFTITATEENNNWQLKCNITNYNGKVVTTDIVTIGLKPETNTALYIAKNISSGSYIADSDFSLELEAIRSNQEETYLVYEWYKQEKDKEPILVEEQTTNIFTSKMDENIANQIVYCLIKEVKEVEEDKIDEEGNVVEGEKVTKIETISEVTSKKVSINKLIPSNYPEHGRQVYCKLTTKNQFDEDYSIDSNIVVFEIDDSLFENEEIPNDEVERPQVNLKQVYIDTKVAVDVTWPINKRYQVYPNYPEYNMYIWDDTDVVVTVDGVDKVYPRGWMLDTTLNSFNYAPGKDYIVRYTKEEIYNEWNVNGENIKFEIQYYPKAEKQRSIVDEKSNRFNLIQKLAETFEVWAYFEIEHDADGRISLDEETKLPKKYLEYRTELGKENWGGFSFDVNLSGITRTVNSKELTTKMWVEKIDNDNSEDGICSIQTANYNIGGELFLINLEYYSQIGLINHMDLVRDLYGIDSNDFGYLKKLGDLNRSYTEITKKLDDKNGLYINLSNSKEELAFQKDSLAAALQELEELVGKKKITDETPVDEHGFRQIVPGGLTSSEAANYDALYNEAKSKERDANEKIAELTTKVEELQKLIDAEEEKLLTINKNKEKLHNQFYELYSRFLLEGTWTGSDYIDSDAYYYDANKVLLESSRPSIEYEIEVYDVSSAYDYEHGDKFDLYKYELGDITYVEDPEYFGYDNYKTPYREKVIISSIEDNLDDPSKTKIEVKNYKTSFEDLFQRTTATVQSYNLNKNVYTRASNFEPTGQINYNSLQNTLSNNNFILASSHNNSVIIDSNGIEVTSLGNIASKVRVVAEGIFYAQDGENYHAAITGDGINTLALAAGLIDVEKINLKNGSFPTFSWDSNGINAYSWSKISENDGLGEYNRMVRFDQYGIYAISDSLFSYTNPFNPGYDYSNTSEPKPIEALTVNQAIDTIEEFAKFSLTWRGFMLKTDSGAVTITSENDIQVKDSNKNERVKLGLIEENNYGLKLLDKEGNTTLKTLDNGEIALTGKMVITSDDSLKGDNFVPTVSIGNLGIEKNESTGFIDLERRILIQNNKLEPQFVVYDTGDIYLKGGISAGTGDIGGFKIEETRLRTENNEIILSTEKDNIGITLKGGSFNIKDATDNSTFSADEYGNITANNITVNGGEFNNINVNDGNFIGSLTATKGFIKGNLILGDKIEAFEIEESRLGKIEDEINNYFIIQTKDGKIINTNEYYYTSLYMEESDENIILLFKSHSNTDYSNYLTYIPINTTTPIINEKLYNYDFVNGLLVENLIFYKVADNNIILNGNDGIIYNFDYYKQENNNGYYLAGNGDFSLKNTSSNFNFTKEGLLINSNKESTTLSTDEDGNEIEIKENNIFSLDEKGQLTVNSINIYGDTNNYISGTLKIGSKESNNGIYLDGSGNISNGTYRTSMGSNGWGINSNGSAVFNDISIKGAMIESSTFVQTSTQAMGGSFIIRPALTFKDDSTIISLGNNIYQGYINEELNEDIGNSYYYIQGNSIYYIFKLIEYSSNFEFNEIKLELVNIKENLNEETLADFITKPLIKVGNINDMDSLGISINAEKTNTPFGYKESITIYTSSLDNNNQIITENKIILGRLPDITILPENIRNTFGLYADNVFLKGAMISKSNSGHTTGINTEQEDGNIIWAGASGDSRGDILNAPFRVTSDGAMYASKGVFSGEIDTSILKATKIIGKENDNEHASLRILNYPNAAASISFEQYSSTVEGEDIYYETARLSSQEFKIAAPLKLFNNKEGLTNNQIEPVLISFMDKDSIVVKEITNYKINENVISGWSLKDNNISFKQIDIPGDAKTNSDKIEQLIENNNELISLSANDENNSLAIKINNQNMLNIQRDKGVEVYQNLILTDSIESNDGIQIAMKVAYDSDNTIIGYDLIIEEK